MPSHNKFARAPLWCALSLALGLAVVSPLADAAGLGRLNVTSGLGQPLRAELEVTSVGRDELPTLQVRMAPLAAFRAANLEFNPALTNPSPFTASVYQQTASCHKVESWQTQVRGFASYIIPRVDVLLSSIMRFQPNATFGVGATPEGNSTGLAANYVLPTGQQVNLLLPGTEYADRINQIDLRVGKLLNIGGTRTNVAIDILNLFNSNTGTAFEQNYGDGSQYLRPTQILNPRFVRFNVTMDF